MYLIRLLSHIISHKPHTMNSWIISKCLYLIQIIKSETRKENFIHPTMFIYQIGTNDHIKYEFLQLFLFIFFIKKLLKFNIFGWTDPKLEICYQLYDKLGLNHLRPAWIGLSIEPFSKSILEQAAALKGKPETNSYGLIDRLIQLYYH